MKQTVWAISSFLMISVLLSGCNSSETRIKPQLKDITQAVYASGKIYPVGYYKVNTTIPGYIETLYVQVGDTVEKGQALFKIKNQTGELAERIAGNNLELAQRFANKNSPLIKAAESEVAGAEVRYKLDSLNFNRQAGLRRQGVGTDLALDQAQTAFKNSQQILKKAKESLKQIIEKAETDAANAQAQMQIAKEQKGDLIVRSAIRGKVYDVISKVGDYLLPQVVVMELGALNDLEVELAIDETDVGYIQPGQEVVYTAEGYDNQYFSGKITKIYPKISTVNKSIKAIASITIPSGVRLFAGATLEANIIYARKAKALVLPKYLVIRDSVWVKKGVGEEKVPVKTGVSDVEFIEILSGISADDEVVAHK